MRDHQPKNRDHDVDERAGVTSTRIGPRPASSDRMFALRHDARATPPHGDVSPDGSRAYPRPSRLARWMVWGGTGATAAALTAGTVMALRQVANMISNRNSDEPAQRKPHPYRPEDAPMPRMHLSAREPDGEPERPHVRPAPRRNLMEEVQSNTAILTSSVDNVMRSVSAAVAGFRNVATQAGEAVREFGDAAGAVRDIIDRRPASPRPHGDAAEPPAQGRRPFHTASKDPAMHTAAHRQPPDLHGNTPLEDEQGFVPPADRNPRIHRL